MAVNEPHCSLTSVSTGTDADAHLGEIYRAPDGKTYKYVQASAAITAAALKAVAYSNATTTAVNVSTTADDGKAAGIIPSGLSFISATSGKLDSGDNFWLQVGGVSSSISAAAFADGAPIGLSTTAGKIDDASITHQGMMGVALAAATDADQNKSVLLRGLV